jgi:uncharacterized surface anchored protein
LEKCKAYILREITTPEGYFPNPNEYVVKVDSRLRICVNGMQICDFNVFNTPIAASFFVTKVDAETGAPVAGAEFALFASGIEVATATSGRDGHITFKNISPGSYTLKEIAPAPGYLLNPKVFNVNVSNEGVVTINGIPAEKFTIPNIRQQVVGGFRVTKINARAGTPLPGAVFGLFQDGALIAQSISDFNGVMSFSNLAPGTYVLREITPPPGYFPNTHDYIVVVNPDGTVTIDGLPAEGFTIPNIAMRFSFSVTKVDSVTGQGLFGATFGLFAGGVLVAEATSNRNGTLTFDNILPGVYTLQEITPPPGYFPNTTVFTVVVNPDGTVVIDGLPAEGFTIPNELLAFTFSVTKIDAVTGAPLAGAVFGLFEGLFQVAEAVSDINGLLTFSRITPGTYTLRETVPPPGYLLNPTVFTVVVNPDGTVTIDGLPAEGFTIPNTAIRFSFSITKVDAITGQVLPGAIFGLYSGGVLVAEALSNPNGTLTFNNIPPGGYTLQEIVPPPGYLPNPTVYSVAVNIDGTITINGFPAEGFTIPNQPFVFKFSIRKVDAATGAPLTGGLFGLFQGGTLIAEAVAGFDGIITFGGISSGTYTLRELVPPPGYAPNPSVFTVVVDVNGFVTIDGTPSGDFVIGNELMAFSFYVRKIDAATGEPLSGGIFGLFFGSTEIATATSDVNGIVNFQNIAPGTYTLRELAAPPGYVPSPETFIVTVNPDGSVFIGGTPADGFPIKNEIMRFSFEVTKIDAETGAPLPGAIFGLFQGGIQVRFAVSDINGILNFGGLPPGTYILRETVPPPGYASNQHQYIVVINPDGSVTVDGIPAVNFTIPNIIIRVSITVLKLDAVTGARLAGAEFGLFQGGIQVATAISNANGEITFNGFTHGTYIMREIVPPPGYQPISHEFIVVIDDFGNVTIDGLIGEGFIILNTLMAFGFDVRKLDSVTGAPLPGAEFGLFSGGLIIATATSDQSGFVVFENLTPGTYILRELVPPPGYVPNPTDYIVVVNPDGSVTINGLPSFDFIIFNTLALFSFNVLKIDAVTGAPLAGAVFNLYENGVPIATAESDANGVVNFDNIPPGMYILHEIVPPPGYAPELNGFNVIVNADGTVTIEGVPADGFTIDNTPLAFSFTVRKIDAIIGVPLEGAVFELTTLDGTVVETVISDFNGLLTFSGIPPGTYILREITPPPGYQLNTTQYIVVGNNESDVTINGLPAEGFTIPDEPLLFSFEIRKIDSHTGVPLPNAQFALLENGVQIQISISGPDGFLFFNNLRPGVYTLLEVVAPPGYLPITHEFVVVINDDGTITVDGIPLDSAVIGNTIIRLSFAIRKTDASTGAPLPDATFELSTLSGDIVAESTSDFNGFLLFENIAIGTYILRETVPPPGYLPNPQTYTVVVNPDGTVFINGILVEDFVIPNQIMLFAFDVLKVDATTDLPLAGAVFGLFENGSLIAQSVSDPNGILAFTDLRPGVYTLQELIPPPGYLLNPTVFTVVVNPDGSVFINGIPVSIFTITNRPIRISFSITKVDATLGFGIPGAIFGFFLNGVIIQDAVSDINGIVTFNNIAPGTYTLQELVPPPGYLPNPTIHVVTVTTDGTVIIDGLPAENFTILNVRALPGINLTKIDAATGLPLAGAVFDLYLSFIRIATATSDENGLISFPNPLPPGTYSLRERTPPPGYLPIGNNFTVVVNPDGSSTINGVPTTGFVIPNIPRLFSFSVVKVDITVGVPIADAVFGLFLNDVQIATATSTSTGEVFFSGLGAGNYTLRELIAPPGYLLTPTVYTVSISVNGIVTINTLSGTGAGTEIEARAAAGFTIPNTPAIQSEPPTINRISSIDRTITGTGRPGCEITVTFPDNSTVTTIVDPTGLWTVDVPSGLTLIVGQSVAATQQCGIYLPSNPVRNIVLPPQESPTPVVNPYVQGNTFITGFGKPGCEIVATLPDGTELTTIIADVVDGFWTIVIPATELPFLIPGAVIELTQACPSMLPSAPVTIPVQAQPLPESPLPTVDLIAERDNIISGTGVPDSEIQVIIPGGRVFTTTVEATGLWSVTIPLLYIAFITQGSVVEVTQTSPGMASSPVYDAVVQFGPRSQRPLVSTIFQGAPGIIGSGLPGCEIQIPFSNMQIGITTVDSNNNWAILVPTGVTLLRGEIVTVIQTCDGLQQSYPVRVAVM